MRRLLPALVAMVVITWAVGVAGNPIPALTYTTNWYVTFGGLGDIGAYQHTWTLAIEEQFYLVWPLAFGLLVGRSRFTLLAALGIVIVASVLALPLTGSIQRNDALLLGAVLALSPRSLPRWAGMAGWAAVATASLVPGPADPGFLILAALISVAVVASPGPITWSPLVWLGGISYGVYLWGYPIWVIVTPVAVAGDGVVSLVWMLGGIALTIVLAAVSERWIERRWRTRRVAHRQHADEPTPNDRVAVPARVIP